MTDTPPTIDDLIEFLSEPLNVQAMADATDEGRPAAEAVADRLIEEFGAVVREDAQKQRIGKFIRRVLEDEGFEWDRAGVPTPGNSLFTAASVYRRKT